VHPLGFVRQVVAIAATGDRSRLLADIKAPTTIELPTIKKTWRCKWCDTVNPTTIQFCGKCGWYGGELCAACQDPSSAIPSGALFRGSLLALLVASVLALWLLIRPPGVSEESGAQAGQPSATRTPVATASIVPTHSPTLTPTGTPSGTPGGTPGISPTPAGTPGISPTPGGTPTATPTPASSPTPTPSEFTEYAVQQGDTLSTIAQRFGTTADELTRINGLTNPNTLDIGQKLKIPTPSRPTPTAAPATP
jgi:LysM repeat protein